MTGRLAGCLAACGAARCTGRLFRGARGAAGTLRVLLTAFLGVPAGLFLALGRFADLFLATIALCNRPRLKKVLAQEKNRCTP